MDIQLVGKKIGPALRPGISAGARNAVVIRNADDGARYGLRPGPPGSDLGYCLPLAILSFRYEILDKGGGYQQQQDQRADKTALEQGPEIFPDTVSVDFHVWVFVYVFAGPPLRRARGSAFSA